MTGALSDTVAIRLLLAIVVVAGVGLLTYRRALPFSVALVVLGLAVSIVAGGPLIEVTPELVLLVLLPGLVFEAAYRLDWHHLRHSFGAIALLAVPGVLVTALIVAEILYLATGLPIELGFVVGAMVAATDPVAVVATFRRLRAPERLQTLLEGESLFNDGTALVVFTIAIGAIGAVGTEVSLGDGVLAFVIAIVASGAMGIAAGWAAAKVHATLGNPLVGLAITLVLAYGTYLLANAIGQSGVIATVVAGVVFGSYGKTGTTSGAAERPTDTIDRAWELIAFVLTAAAFILIGFAIADAPLIDAAGWIAWAIVAILVARAVVVYGMLGAASAVAHRVAGSNPVPAGWLHTLFWGGLRGAVAVAMALSLPADFPQRALLQQITFGVVLFTLLAQGLSIDWLVGRLRLTSR